MSAICSFCGKHTGTLLAECDCEGARNNRAKNKKKPILKLSPELADGDHWTVCDNERCLLESVKAWYDEFKNEVGESFTVEVIEMSQAEIEAMPEL